MSTFAQLAALNGVGVAYYFDVSTDKFATVAYRYATTSGKLDGANWYEPRLLKLGTLARQLDSTAMASHTIDVSFDNVDGGVDWISNRATVASTLYSSLWRLVVVLFDPNNVADMQTKVVGIFECMEMPRRTASDISLTLSDRWQGHSMDLATTPTLADIAADLYSARVLPDPNIYNCNCLIDPDMPLPLAWGGASLSTPALRICRGGNGFAGFVVCCTTDTSAAAQGEIGGFAFGPDIGGRYNSSGFETATGILRTKGSYTLWNVVRSSTVVKSGKNWKVIFITLDANAFIDSTRYADFLPMPDPNTAGNTWINTIDALLDKWTEFSVQAPGNYYTGSVMSARTYFSTVDHGAVHGVDIAYDLVAYYSTLTTTDIDATSFTAARAGLGLYIQTLYVNVGVPFGNLAGNRLTRLLANLVIGANLDLFVGWSGALFAAQKVALYAVLTNSLNTFDETQILAGSIAERIPSLAERWAWNPVEASYSDWGTLWSSWLQSWQNAGNNVRPVVTFRYPLSALNNEIGDYVFFSWTRGGHGLGPYTNAIFKIEGLSLDPFACEVEVTLVWMDDIPTMTNQPYLLDDETLILRNASSGGRTATVQNASGTVTFSSGSLITDGVAAGDLLVLLDATLGATDFTRFRALLITSVTDATHLVVTGDLAFGAASPTAVATWNIVKGKTTYPTAISDPTNYPNGSAFYGKTTNSTGTFSDASAGNQLIGG